MSNLSPLLPAPMFATLIPRFKFLMAVEIYILKLRLFGKGGLKTLREIPCRNLRKFTGHPQHSGINRKTYI
jgi:hypothetical protein